MTLFQVLAEDDGDSMVQHIAVLSSLLRAGLADSSPAVRVAAARCVAALATCTFKVGLHLEQRDPRRCGRPPLPCTLEALPMRLAK